MRIDASMPFQDVNVQSKTKPADSRLRNAGEQFESMLLTDAFSKLRKSFSLTNEASDAAHDTLSSMADEALCRAIAARGGLGLGTMLTRALGRK